MSIKYFILLTVAGSLLTGSDTLNYTVKFWKIPCVYLTITTSENNQESNRRIVFTTKTAKLFDFFFSVNNFYSTTFDPITYQIKKYEKKINQSNLKQKMVIEWDSEKTGYWYKKTFFNRPPETHNIFSLFVRGRESTIDEIDTKQWYLDHEGTLMTARYLWVDSTIIKLGDTDYPVNHYRFDIFETGNKKNINLKMTDIFSWGITLDNCTRQLWIERDGKKRILKAKVNVRGFTLTAELDND